jgi:hypothetical protein
MPKHRLQQSKPRGFHQPHVGLGTSAESKRRMADFLNGFEAVQPVTSSSIKRTSGLSREIIDATVIVGIGEFSPAVGAG